MKEKLKRMPREPNLEGRKKFKAQRPLFSEGTTADKCGDHGRYRKSTLRKNGIRDSEKEKKKPSSHAAGIKEVDQGLTRTRANRQVLIRGTRMILSSSMQI
jgi:hypothetical protein